jgi:hypothetical protein
MYEHQSYKYVWQKAMHVLNQLANSPKHPKPVPLTLVPPKEVKIDLNDFDVKLGENSSCTAF